MRLLWLLLPLALPHACIRSRTPVIDTHAIDSGATVGDSIQDTKHLPDTGDTSNTSDTCDTGDPSNTGDTGDTFDTGAPSLPENIVFILADDMRPDMSFAMPYTETFVLARAARFENAIAPTPLCVPSRTSILSGGFPSHDTHVLTNRIPNGGQGRFDDTRTLPVLLQEQGYRTGLFGKYLEQAPEWVDYIAPGWDAWSMIVSYEVDYSWWCVEGASGMEAEELVDAYGSEDTLLLDYMGDRIEAFLRESDEPFFLYIPTVAPHRGLPPAPEDASLYTDFAWRGDGYNEGDVSDKPSWVQAIPQLTLAERERLDLSVRISLQTLASLDRLFERVMEVLDEDGRLDRTWFVFTADSGIAWGEHRWTDKGVPYDAALRVPLWIAGPGLDPVVQTHTVPATLDVPATLLAITGADTPTEGIDLRIQALEGAPEGRERVQIEGHAIEVPVWTGFRSDRWKYVEYSSGERELYDLEADPGELENLAGAPPHEVDLNEFHAWVEAERGLAILNRRLPYGKISLSYSTEIETWGGTAPLSWSAGELPEGLSLDEDGVLSGELSDYGYGTVTVTDASVSPYDGEPQSYTVVLGVTPPP